MAAQTTAEALAGDFAAAIARGEPCYAAGAAAGRFELSSFLEIAQTDDGGMCSATLPAEGGVYAGGAARRDVQLPLAAIVAAEATIIGNFLLMERFVFQDMKGAASGGWVRFAKSFGFNNAEAIVRIPLVALLVETGHVSAVLATAITLVLAFFVRFVFFFFFRSSSEPSSEPPPARGRSFFAQARQTRTLTSARFASPRSS